MAARNSRDSGSAAMVRYFVVEDDGSITVGDPQPADDWTPEERRDLRYSAANGGRA